MDAFRADRIALDHGLAPEAGPEGAAAVRRLAAAGQAPWRETIALAKEIGEVDVRACSLSMDLFDIEESDLDPLVDGVEGVTAFLDDAASGPIIFI